MMKQWLMIITGAVLVCAGVVCVRSSSHDPVDSCVLVYNGGGRGSGVIVGSNVILTARHVAEQPDLHVKTNDGQDYEVVGVTLAEHADAALLFIDGKFDEPVLRVSQKTISVGDRIVVIGTPYDTANFNCVLGGQVVKVGLTIEEWPDLNVLDAHAGPGCSGGPVIFRGGVVGIVVAGEGMLTAELPVVDFATELGL